MATRQALGRKARVKIASKIGMPVMAAFVNGDIPHMKALVWVNADDAYFVHIRKGTKIKYISNKKLVLRRFNVKLFKPDMWCEKCGFNLAEGEHSCGTWENLRSSIEPESMVESGDHIYQLREDRWIQV